DLQPPVPQRGKPQVSRHLSAHQQRLCAERRIIHYFEVVYVKSRTGKYPVFDLPNLHLPAQSAAQGSREAIAKAYTVDVGRQETCQRQQCNGSDDELLPADGFLLP